MNIAKPENPDISLDDQALQIIELNAVTSVQNLYELLKAQIPSLTKSELVDTVWRLADRGKASLEDTPLTEVSFCQYIGHWERSLWLEGVLAVSFATIFTVYAVPVGSPFVVLRWILGSIFVLFVPGFATVQALYPRSIELGSTERFALSIGLSIAFMMLVGLLLNYTPLGIRLTPIVMALTLLTAGVTIIALARQLG